MLSTQSELADTDPTRPWPADRLERWPIERLIPYAKMARPVFEIRQAVAQLQLLRADRQGEARGVSLGRFE